MQNEHDETIASLHFIRGQILFEYPHQNRMVRKCLSPDAVRNALLQQEFDSGWIAPRTIRHGEGPHGPWAIQHYPAASYTLLFDQSISTEAHPPITRLTLPLPAFILIGTQRRFSLYAIRCWRNDATVLYHAPLPNISTEGRICYGTTSPPATSPLTIREAWRLFWRSTFNNDHASGKSHSHPDNIVTQLQNIADQRPDQYPGDDLVRTSMTMSDILQSLNQGDD
jgi:hypothetical protein